MSTQATPAHTAPITKSTSPPAQPAQMLTTSLSSQESNLNKKGRGSGLSPFSCPNAVELVLISAEPDGDLHPCVLVVVVSEYGVCMCVRF